VTLGWRSIYDEKLHNLYSSPNIVTVIKSKLSRWAGHVTRMWQINAPRILVEKPKRKRPLERLSVHRMIILKWILKK